MHFNTMKRLRQQIYESFERSRDALFNLNDALLSEGQARSLAELSLSVFFERRWPSVYEALQDGRLDEERLRQAFVEALMANQKASEPVWVSIDSSGMERVEAVSNRDRGMIYKPNLPYADKPVSVGWQFSTLMLLPSQPSSWVGVLDQRRISTQQTAIEVGIAQLRAVLPLLKRSVIVLADRWYAGARFVQACHELGCGGLIRLKRNRKLYRAAPPRQPKQRGAPRKHGALFQGTRPETYGPADGEWESNDEQGKRVAVSCWKHLHLREAAESEVCVIRVQREAAKETKRDPRESWFIWTGSQEVPLEQVCTWYGKRFSHEHGYRFLKQDLLWTRAHLRTPEQVERWSWVVACACNQLLLAKELGLARKYPWESTQRPLTPRQVRRVMPSILQQLGTPAGRVKPRGKSPGWPKGRKRTPAPRFPVVRKPKPVPKTHRKRA
ncbi:MAG TPA: NF041680 family putative transposase [Ktedonobacteraceae bacterium]